jgi:hypothetical protein
MSTQGGVPAVPRFPCFMPRRHPRPLNAVPLRARHDWGYRTARQWRGQIALMRSAPGIRSPYFSRLSGATTRRTSAGWATKRSRCTEMPVSCRPMRRDASPFAASSPPTGEGYSHHRTAERGQA